MTKRAPRQQLRLWLLQKLSRFAPAAPPPGRAERLLVIRPDHLGDVLLCTPALRQLRTRYPQAHITALVGPWGAPALANNPHVDKIAALPFPGFTRRPKPSLWQPYKLLRQWTRQLRGQFDAAYVLRFDHWWGAWLAALAGIPRRIGYATPETLPFLTDARPYTPGQHEVQQNLCLVSAPAAVSSSQAQGWLEHGLEFQPTASARAWAKAMVGDSAPIAIHPGAGAAVKLWRIEGWAATADALAKESNAPIVLSGSAAERPMCQQIVEQMSAPAQILAGETDLEQLAALFAACRLVLGLDSGPLHLAAAQSVPSVQLYGPVDPAIFGPWGPPERQRVVVSNWPCIPCNRLDYAAADLPNHPCVRVIRPAQVIAAAQQAIESL